MEPETLLTPLSPGEQKLEPITNEFVMKEAIEITPKVVARWRDIETVRLIRNYLAIEVVLLLSAIVVTAAPAPLAPNRSNTTPPPIKLEKIELISTNRILLLKAKKDISNETADSLPLALGLKPEKHPKKLKQWRVFSIPPGKDKHEIITILKRSGRFEYVEEPKVYTTQETIPNDPMFPSLWGMTNISAPLAWDKIKEAPDVVVAVVDTGIDFTHPDLVDNLWTGPNGEHGYVATNGVVLPGGQDDHGHGTHVAGTIGAVGNNGVGVVGLAWSARIMAMKVLHHGSGTDIDIVNGYEKLVELKESGVNVIVSNHSYGGNGTDQFLEDGFQLLDEADIFSAVAAGNSNIDIDQSPFLPADFPFNSMVVATAIDSGNKKASFSNFGLIGTDIAAPGVGILSTTRSNTYSLFSGTSMAAPHVAGVAVLLRQSAPQLSASKIRDVILHPDSYDSLPQLYQNNTSAKVNLWKALNNLGAPSNRPPVITSASPYTLITNSSTYSFSATAHDPDGDSIRLSGFQDNRDFANFIPNLIKKNGFVFSSTNGTITVSGNPFAYQFASFLNIGASDNRGGAAITNTGFEFLLDRNLRRPIPVKTWLAHTNAGTNSVSFTFDVDDQSKSNYSVIIHLLNDQAGFQGWFGLTPGPTEITISPGFDHIRPISIRIFCMDRYLNYTNTEPVLFAGQPIRCPVMLSTNEGNVPLSVSFNTGANCWLSVQDYLNNANITTTSGQFIISNPGFMLAGAITTYPRSGPAPYESDVTLHPIFASRFLGAPKPSRIANLTISKAPTVTGPWSHFTNFTDTIEGPSQFYRLDISK